MKLRKFDFIAGAILVASLVQVFLLVTVAYSNVINAPRVVHLQAVYQAYNEAYFGNRLPKTVDIGVKRLADNMGESWQDSGGRYHISVDSASNPVEKQAEMTLIHEMCHVDVSANGSSPVEYGPKDPHGPEFQACMMDVAKQGGFKNLW